MDLVNNAATIGSSGKNLVLETAGHVYVKVNERYYELDFKNSGANKLSGRPIVNETIQPVEEVDLSDYITNEDLKRTLKKYVTERSWQDVMDTQSALQNSLLDFEEAIKPITVQTMQVVVGTEELQFDWIYDFTHVRQPNNHSADTPLYIDEDESSEYYGELVWNPGYIKHYTIDGPNTVMPDTTKNGSDYTDDRLKDYWRWYITNSVGKDELEEIHMDGTFYVYLKVPYSNEYNSNTEDYPGGGPHNANLYLNEDGDPQSMLGSGKYAKTGIGQVIYSPEAIKFGPEYDDATGLDYYYLLYAIVTNSDGSPSIATLNGFTEILPGQIRAYIFATSDGTQYLDFLHERFRIGNESEFLSWEDGKLQIKGSISVTSGDLKDTLDNLQSQIDDEVQCWFSTDAKNAWDTPLPTKDNPDKNWPVIQNDWEPKDHIGDLYYVVEDDPDSSVNEQGQAFRYIKDGDRYYWTRVLDNSVSLALYNAYLARQAAYNARNILNEIANDKIITIQEHGQLRELLNNVIAQCEQAKASAEPYKTIKEVADAISNLDNCQRVLETFINENVLDKTDSYEIGEDYTKVWDNVFDALKELSQAIAVASSDKIEGAQGTADAAIEKFKTWASDDVISGPEIPEIRSEKEFITNDFSEISSRAARYEITAQSIYKNYETAYNAYLNDLNAILNAWKTKKSDVTEVNIPTDMKKHVEEFYKERTALLQEFAEKNAEVIKAAQDTADSAVDRFRKWADDGVISPLEISGIETEYNFIQQDYLDQSNKADKLHLTSDGEWLTYKKDYDTYRKSLKAVLEWWDGVKDTDKKTDTYTIPDEFETNLDNYYKSRLNFIKLALDKSLVTDIDYIKDAIKKGRTDINGGLIMTGLIELGFSRNNKTDDKTYDEPYYDAYQVMSGINGMLSKDASGEYDYKSPAVWFGGEMVDREKEIENESSNNLKTLWVWNSSESYQKYSLTSNVAEYTIYKWNASKSSTDPAIVYSWKPTPKEFIYGPDSETPFAPATIPKFGEIELFKSALRVELTQSTNVRGKLQLYEIGNVNLSNIAYTYDSDSDSNTNEPINIISGTFVKFFVTNHIQSIKWNFKYDYIYVQQDTNVMLVEHGFAWYRIEGTLYDAEKRTGFLGKQIQSAGTLQNVVISVDIYDSGGSETQEFYKWENTNSNIYTIDQIPDKDSTVYTIKDGGPQYTRDLIITDLTDNGAKALFRMNGSGYLANGNISWDESGDLNFGHKAMSIQTDGTIDLGYLHSDPSSFWIGTNDKKMLEVSGNKCKINGSLSSRASSYYNESFISVEDSSGTIIADIGSEPLSTAAVPSYLRQSDNISAFYAKGSVGWGTVNIPNGWEYQILDPYLCYIDGDIYKLNSFNLSYDFCRVSKSITLSIVLRDKDLIKGTVDDTKVYTKTFNVNKSSQSGKITANNFNSGITSGISLSSFHSYTLIMTLSNGQVQSSIKSDSWISIERGTCEAQITRDLSPIPKGTFIRPNGISSVFGKNSKFQWLGAMSVSYPGYNDYRDKGGSFIVTLPADKNGDNAESIIGLELTGYMDSSGNGHIDTNTPGIRINLGDGWHKLKIDNGTLKVVN